MLTLPIEMNPHRTTPGLIHAGAFPYKSLYKINLETVTPVVSASDEKPDAETSDF